MLVLSEQKDRANKRMFIPEGFQAEGWWRFMKSVFELPETPLAHPDKRGSIFQASVPPVLEFAPTWSAALGCPQCKFDFTIKMKSGKKKSFAKVLQSKKSKRKRVVKTQPDPVLNRKANFEFQNAQTLLQMAHLKNQLGSSNTSKRRKGSGLIMGQVKSSKRREVQKLNGFGGPRR